MEINRLYAINAHQSFSRSYLSELSYLDAITLLNHHTYYSVRSTLESHISVPSLIPLKLLSLGFILCIIIVFLFFLSYILTYIIKDILNHSLNFINYKSKSNGIFKSHPHIPVPQSIFM